MRETLPLLKLYKTLIILAIVIGPIYWLMFTDDGKRRTDTMVLWLFGGDSIDINFAVLDTGFREADWKAVYKDLEWRCKNSNSAFGDRLCFAEIASYNGVPAQYISVFFNQSGSSAVKLVYRDQYHQQIGQDLFTQLGQPQSPVNKDKVQVDQSVLQWQTANGAVLIKKDLKQGEEPVLMWLSRSTLTNSVQGRS